MKQILLHLGVDRALRLFAYGLSFLLILLLITGVTWALRLPPTPMVFPDPQALVPATVLLPESRIVDPPSGATPAGDASPLLVGSVTDLLGSENGRTTDITTRPLFWASRRPIDDDQEQVSADTERPHKEEFDQVRLVGVYFAGANSGVIYELKNERLRLRLDDELMGWTLNMLSADSAVFTRDEDEKILQLEHAKTGKYTATAKPAPARAPSSEMEVPAR